MAFQVLLLTIKSGLRFLHHRIADELVAIVCVLCFGGLVSFIAQDISGSLDRVLDLGAQSKWRSLVYLCFVAFAARSFLPQLTRTQVQSTFLSFVENRFDVTSRSLIITRILMCIVFSFFIFLISLGFQPSLSVVELFVLCGAGFCLGAFVCHLSSKGQTVYSFTRVSEPTPFSFVISQTLLRLPIVRFLLVLKVISIALMWWSALEGREGLWLVILLVLICLNLSVFSLWLAQLTRSLWWYRSIGMTYSRWLKWAFWVSLFNCFVSMVGSLSVCVLREPNVLHGLAWMPGLLLVICLGASLFGEPRRAFPTVLFLITFSGIAMTLTVVSINLTWVPVLACGITGVYQAKFFDRIAGGV